MSFPDGRFSVLNLGACFRGGPVSFKTTSCFSSSSLSRNVASRTYSPASIMLPLKSYFGGFICQKIVQQSLQLGFLSDGLIPMLICSQLKLVYSWSALRRKIVSTRFTGIPLSFAISSMNRKTLLP